METLPSTRFEAMWRILGAKGPWLAAFDRLRAAYDEPHRAYHDASHIAACLALFARPEIVALAEHPAEVQAALWYHDAIYDTRAADNEERSARLATETLTAANVDAGVVARIAEHVISTLDHAARSADGQLVIDIDLSILGADLPTFEAFDDAIRREYAWVPEEDYRLGRAKVLRRFLDRPRIFVTPALHDLFEAAARKNLATAIERLESQ